MGRHSNHPGHEIPDPSPTLVGNLVEVHPETAEKLGFAKQRCYFKTSNGEIAGWYGVPGVRKDTLGVVVVVVNQTQVAMLLGANPMDLVNHGF